MTTSIIFDAAAAQVVLRPWERVVTWAALALGVFGLFGLPYAAGTTWSVVWELVASGALSIFFLVPPVVFLVGVVLLALRRKWAIVWVGIHVPLAIAYLSSRHGLGSISAVWWFGYGCEALLICFCFRLWSRGALK